MPVRTKWPSWAGIVVLPLLSLTLISGCSKKGASGEAKVEAEKVMVAPAGVWEIEDSQEFTGRVEAVERVDLRAMVTGYLKKLCFREGAEVRKGDLLFE